MCDVDVQEISEGNFDITCLTSGKPITISDEFGMWCEDKCNYQESIDATEELKNLLEIFTGKISA